MKFEKIVDSWNFETSKDCFGLGNPSNIDHIYPRSEGGSDIKENRQRISVEANELKGDSTKGEINGIRFSIEKRTAKVDNQGNQHIHGIMYIRNPKWTDGVWYKVNPVT